MTEREILKIAIMIAWGRGYNRFASIYQNTFEVDEATLENKSYFAIIFDTYFAKALFGRGYESVCSDSTCNREEHRVYVWQVKLQEMVLEAEPLRYLERYLVDNKS